MPMLRILFSGSLRVATICPSLSETAGQADDRGFLWPSGGDGR
jgi:hypothetical protein